ncbi:Uncharacterized protein SCF082_LOCUS25539 [Durusdinium trenchii]|uniref:Uncharacterized protein n=1 Tax=Durusdinium trenchii TaxID=1381693 RepID=A0ABP0M372_9DINO
MPFKRSLPGRHPTLDRTPRPKVGPLHEGFALTPPSGSVQLPQGDQPPGRALPWCAAHRDPGPGEPKPYGRGSAEAALKAAQDPQRCRQVLAEEASADTSKGPLASRQKLWASLANTAGWGDPFHLNPSMIYTVMGALKVGGYRSAQLYLDAAKNCHIAQGLPWSDQLRQAYRAAVRSCNRGIGNSKQAGGLPLEQVAALPPMGQLVKGGPRHPVAATVLASWWLLREIEASRARRKHITVNVTDRRVTWRLPSSKTDQAALGAERSHTCSCALHSPNLCPFHLMVGHLANLPEALDQPIFPAEDDQIPASKDGWADTFEQLAIHLGLPVTHNNGARMFTGHSARVTGARFMAEHNIELWRIQLFGRWGSDVFIHYIQDAPLKQLDKLALESTATMSVQRAQEQLQLLQQRIASCKSHFMHPEPDMLQDCAAGIPQIPAQGNRPGVIIQNTARDGKVHATLIYKLDLPPKQWRTRCGWPFGKNQADFKVHDSVEATPLQERCSKCFPKTRATRVDMSSSTDDQRAQSASGED